MRLFGVHGTKSEYVDSICTKGFAISEKARSGPGAYFWRYFEDPCYSQYLALQWCKNKFKNLLPPYPNISLIFVELEVEQEKILNISHGMDKERVRQHIHNQLKIVEEDYDRKFENEDKQLSKREAEDKRKDFLQTKIHDVYANFFKKLPIEIVIVDTSLFVGIAGRLGLFYNSAETIVVMPHIVNKIKITNIYHCNEGSNCEYS